jgi:hypothetical protein
MTRKTVKDRVQGAMLVETAESSSSASMDLWLTEMCCLRNNCIPRNTEQVLRDFWNEPGMAQELEFKLIS